MKYLYKYPQTEFPYRDLVETNRPRSREEMEYELLDTGIFNDDRYFDVFVEYAKADPEDMLIRISVHNRGPEAAQIHLLPTLWFRNTWSWGDERSQARSASGRTTAASWPRIPKLGDYTLQCEGAPELLFTENESNASRLVGPAEPFALREGCLPRVRDRGEEGGGQSREIWHKGGCALCSRRAGGGIARSFACA